MHADDSCKHPGVLSFQKWVAGRAMTGDGHFSVPCPVVQRVQGVFRRAWHAVSALPGDAARRGWGWAVPAASLLPHPPSIAPAEVIWCALLFPLRGLGSRRMALWGSSESGSWREAEHRGRKTLAFHSSFSQFILRDQLHAKRQLGVLFSFQLCTVGEAGKVIFFFSLFYCSMMLLWLLYRSCCLVRKGSWLMMLRVPALSLLCAAALWGEALFTAQGLVSAQQLCWYFPKVVWAFLSAKLGK